MTVPPRAAGLPAGGPATGGPAPGGPATGGTAVDAGTGCAITSTGLTKRFRGGQVAVNAIDLAVPAGGIYGFLGPNGSGKTTSIRLLLGLIRPTAGTHTMLGEPMPVAAGNVLPRVGTLVEGPAFHPYLNGRDNLARLDAADRTVEARTARQRIDAALDRVGLLAAATKRYRAYSLGMRQRLALAATLLRPRDLLILDEPTNGLDPQGTREVRNLLQSLAGDGTTVLLSTHLLSEVEQICTHVGVMHQGRLIAQGSLAQLQARTDPRVEVHSSDPRGAARTLSQLGMSGVDVDGTAVTALLDGHEPEKVVVALVTDGVPIRGFAVRAAGLEEMFVGMTGEGFDVSG